jgi:hypothetical protein
MRAEHKIGPQAEWISINSTSAIPNRTAYFKMPPADPAGVIFDKSVSPDLEVRPMYGFMFVHPKVDGKDVGWFFLDSGADVMCIDPAIAKTLGLKTVGGDVTAGAVGVAITPIGLAHKFQLGPVTLNNPIFYQLDLSAITKALNMPIAGVCGYDFIARTSLDIDLTQRQIRVLPPGQAILPAKAHWDRIDFDSNTPCIRCGFEGDHKGVFNLDTGSNSSVELFGPEVEKDHFLTRKTSGGRTSGAGGSAAVREGKLDWFEIGGTRLDKLDASFELTKKGVFASPYLAGNVGMGVLNKFHLLFDYQNSRMAFIAR